MHGPAIVDECDTVCRCLSGSRYACGRRGCPAGRVSGKPQTCTKRGVYDLPRIPGLRVFCHDGIVKAQGKGETVC